MEEAVTETADKYRIADQIRAMQDREGGEEEAERLADFSEAFEHGWFRSWRPLGEAGPAYEQGAFAGWDARRRYEEGDGERESA